jgi:outer membrane usher protein
VLAPEPASTNALNLPQILFLSIEVNATPVKGVFYAEQFNNGKFILVEEAWLAANLNLSGLKVPMGNGQFGYDLNSLPGVIYDLDTQSQSIKITAPSHSFGITNLTNDVNLAYPTKPSPLGAYLNYNLTSTSVNSNQGSNSYGAFVEGVVFNEHGSLLSSMVTSVVNNQSRSVRAETYFQKDMPSDMEKLIIGDSLSSAGSWSRPLRFGGIAWSTNFGLKQGFISSATPSINGSAALPSTVEVFIDNQKRQSDSVNAGPFQINNFPMVSGAGEINVAVKDILGVQTITTQSFYSTPRLLRNDLNVWKVIPTKILLLLKPIVVALRAIPLKVVPSCNNLGKPPALKWLA